jgi:CRISPR-associated endonuclease Cas1
MHEQSTAPRNGVAVAHGYGIKIYVDRGHLVVHDGIGSKRETRRFARATCGLKRLFVIGHTGYITFEAARWLRDVGAAYAQIDGGGDVVLISGSVSTDHPPLRRAQALAVYSDSGISVARLLLTDKTDGQAALLPELPATEEARNALRRACRDLAVATSTDRLLTAEAAAATAYWDAWSTVPVPFPKREASQLPAQWLSFGQRHSTLTGSPRRAINPANAILNYLYALLEVEAALACSAVGLDPGLGIFHADRKARDSFALDVMEACRPLVDAYLLTLLRHRTLSRRDFVETSGGNCRLRPRLARELATTAPTWATYLAPVVERTAQAIADAAAKPFQLPTSLTGIVRRAAWAPRRRTSPRTTPKLPPLPASCRGCGGELPNHKRRYCDSCRRGSAERAGHSGRAAAAAALEWSSPGSVDTRGLAGLFLI